jgi:hypothetical protein
MKKIVFHFYYFQKMAELITGRIYIIRSPNTEMVYVGHTIQTLKIRFCNHKSTWKTKTGSCTSFLVLEKGSAYIELLEEVEVESERELEIIEQKWIDQTPNTVNKNKTYLTDEERAQKHRDLSREYGREHKEKIAEYNKKYREANKEELKKKSQVKVVCEVCDCYVLKRKKKQHELTKKHTRNLEKSS